MKRILLYWNPGWDKFLATSPYYALMTELRIRPRNTITLRIMGESLDDINNFDWVIFDDYTTISQYRDKIPERVKTACLICDTHHFSQEGIDNVIKNCEGYDMILGPSTLVDNGDRYDDKFLIPQSHPIRKKFVWFPNSLFPWPVGFKPRSGAILSGCISPISYPFRLEVANANLKDLTVLEHAGYDTTKHDIVREKFIEYLSTFKAGITCGGQLSYVVAKYYEIQYAGCVLLAKKFLHEWERELLGFEDGKNCYLFDKVGDSFKTRYNHILENYEAYSDVVKNAYGLIMTRHTAWHRLNYLQMLCDLESVPNRNVQFALFRDCETTMGV